MALCGRTPASFSDLSPFGSIHTGLSRLQTAQAEPNLGLHTSCHLHVESSLPQSLCDSLLWLVSSVVTSPEPIKFPDYPSFKTENKKPFCSSSLSNCYLILFSRLIWNYLCISLLLSYLLSPLNVSSVSASTVSAALSLVLVKYSTDDCLMWAEALYGWAEIQSE